MAVKTRADELRDNMQIKSAAIEGMAQSWGNEDGKFVVSPAQHADYLKAVGDLREIKALYDAETFRGEVGAFLDAPAGTSLAAQQAADAQRGNGLVQVKTLSGAWAGSDEVKAMRESGWRMLGKAVEINQGIADLATAAAISSAMQGKDVFSAMGGNIPNIPTIGSAQSLGWTERTLRPGRVRDLFPAERTSASVLHSIRETGFINRARVVPQRRAADGVSAPTGGATDVFGLKPKSELSIVPVTYPIATIAHIMYVHRETLEDEPRMRGLLDRDMVDGVKMAEDAALLYGDGIGGNLTGLMNTPGIQEYNPAPSADKKSAQVRRAMTRAILAFFQPTGVVMSPLDWEDLELETDDTGAYRIAVSVAVGGEKRVWRLNVVDTPAMAEGDYLLGGFGTAAKVYDREQVNVMVSTENRDLFERNAYTLRAEERVGLVVDRPEAFVVGQWKDPV